MSYRFGFVVILGPTNSGKSTLMNALMGQKLSIVSAKPQTTCHGIRGVLTTANHQIVFTDTPGMQRYPQTLPRLLNRVADNSKEGCDIAVWVFDVSSTRFLRQVENMKEKIEKDFPIEKRICVLNKVDLVHKETLLPLLAQLDQMKLFGELFPMSAKKGANVGHLKGRLFEMLPEGEPMYPADTLTDRSMNFRLSEAIREKIYAFTHQEIPYSAYIDIEEYQAADDKVPTLHASICMDSDSKKGIVIGKQGEMLKKIGTLARKDIEKIVGKKICLKLHVKVDDQWTGDSRKIQRFLEQS